MDEEIVYLSNANTIERVLTRNDRALTAAEYGAITRCQVLVGATLLDSAVSPTLFDLTQTDRIVLKFGSAALQTGKRLATLVVFDDAHPAGLVWDQFSLTVRSVY